MPISNNSRISNFNIIHIFFLILICILALLIRQVTIQNDKINNYSTMAPETISTETMLPEAIFVPDFEMSAHGKNFNTGCVLGGGAVVIEPQKFAKYIIKQNGKISFKPITREILEDLIPKENRFRAYIHDEEAIAADFNNPIWKEDVGREFWTKQDSQHKQMFEKLIQEMKKSNLNPAAFTRCLNKFTNTMIQKYGKIIFVSDTSNFDIPLWDHYRRTYLNDVQDSNMDRVSINHATQNGFVLPIDTGSFYAGLTRKPFSFDVWDNLNSDKWILEAGYSLPITTEIIDKDSHDPLEDAIGIAIKFAAVVYQLNNKS